MYRVVIKRKPSGTFVTLKRRGKVLGFFEGAQIVGTDEMFYLRELVGNANRGARAYEKSKGGG